MLLLVEWNLENEELLGINLKLNISQGNLSARHMDQLCMGHNLNVPKILGIFLDWLHDAAEHDGTFVIVIWELM